MKRCRDCGRLRPLAHFYRHGEGRPRAQRQSYCRACCAARQRATIESSKRWIRDYARRWRRKNRAVVAQANAFVAELPRGLTTYYRLRHAAILAYGGYRCACCGIGDPRFLTLDHVHGDGAPQRRTLGPYTSHKFHRWLRDNGYPPGFQVLCWNCNCGRHRNGGVCPHQEERAALTPPRARAAGRSCGTAALPRRRGRRTVAP